MKEAQQGERQCLWTIQFLNPRRRLQTAKALMPDRQLKPEMENGQSSQMENPTSGK